MRQVLHDSSGAPSGRSRGIASRGIDRSQILQDFLRATGYLPKNVEPAALGKLRKIPVVSWVRAGKWAETGESFHEEDVKATRKRQVPTRMTQRDP